MRALDEYLTGRMRGQLDELSNRVVVLKALTLLDGLSEDTSQLPADDGVLLRALEEADAAVAAAERVRSTLATLGAERKITTRIMASKVRATHATVAVWAKQNRPGYPTKSKEPIAIDEAS